MENKIKVLTFVALVVVLVLVVIIAVGNWKLYSRVEKIETTLGLRATPQSQQTPSLLPQPKTKE